jgi:hypothetical protein
VARIENKLKLIPTGFCLDSLDRRELFEGLGVDARIMYLVQTNPESGWG